MEEIKIGEYVRTPEQTKLDKLAKERQTKYMDMNYMNTNFAQQGWQCPICKRVLAPFVPECPCGGQGMKTWTITTTEGTVKLEGDK